MRISDWSSDVCSSDLGAVRLDNAGFDIAEIGVDDEIADALGIDRAADLAEQLLIIAGEVLAQRIGDQRGDAGAVAQPDQQIARHAIRSEEHTSELQSLMRISYAVFCLKKNKK